MSNLQRWTGSDAVREAAKHYDYRGPITPEMAHLIHEEGFVGGEYGDSKGISTFGVGQTGDYADKNFFTEVFPEFYTLAYKNTKDFHKLPAEAKSAIISMAYRGDWGPNTKKALARGDWKAAVKQYLDHDEYRKGRARTATSAQRAISDRMERNAQALKALLEDA